jgi:hypothetical protein
MWASRLARAAWSVPIAIAVNNLVIGVAVADAYDGGRDLCLVLRPSLAERLGLQPIIGDMIAISSPQTPGKTLVRLVVALSDDVLRPAGDYRMASLEQIRKHHCWVEGEDPRSDSRTFGQVPTLLIEGRPLATLRLRAA